MTRERVDEIKNISRINKIYNIDCIDGMKLMKENGLMADSIITDPPFNISIKNNFRTMKGRTGIDFGEWDKGFDLTGWIKPALDVLKDGGNIVIFSAWRNMGEIAEELEKHGCLVKEMMMWKKSNPMPRNRDRLYVTSCEFAIWATKGKGWVFNRQRSNYENTIFEYPIVSSKQRIHPTQKNNNLMEQLIKIHTNEHQLVLDPFTGSASTAIACINTDRKYIGFELNEDCFNLANGKINNYKKIEKTPTDGNQQ